MARNPKQDENLKPIKKGQLSKEEAKKRGSKGGKKSAEVRREKRDAKEAALYILNLAAKGQLKENLATLGVEAKDQTNMVALQARLFTMAMSGNIEAYQKLMQMAGFEPEENRKERESLASERRREAESEAKVNALGGNIENAKVAVNLSDEDENTDVVIYLPQIEDEKSCEVPPEDADAKGDDESEGDQEDTDTETK